MYINEKANLKRCRSSMSGVADLRHRLTAVKKMPARMILRAGLGTIRTDQTSSLTHFPSAFEEATQASMKARPMTPSSIVG